MSNTLNYYNSYFDEYYDKTVGIDMSNLYDRFLRYINYSGEILDLGCGSGRDSFFFSKKGYDVTAIDGSENLARKASKLLSKEVKVCKFEDLALNKEQFDGVWALASLLHVSKENIVDVINNVSHGLKDGGVFYMSFKYGDIEYIDCNDRYFNCYTEDSFKDVLKEVKSLKIIEMYKTEDKMPNRDNLVWLNVLCMKNNN